MKYICTECGWVGEKYLEATNPFDPKDTIVGCPQCKSVEAITQACDEPGCTRQSTCGFPTKNGYRRTCHEHSDFKRENNG